MSAGRKPSVPGGKIRSIVLSDGAMKSIVKEAARQKTTGSAVVEKLAREINKKP